MREETQGFDENSDGWTTCGGDCDDSDGTVDLSFPLPPGTGAAPCSDAEAVNDFETLSGVN